MVEVKTCPICHENNLSANIKCRDYTVTHEEFSLVKCKACDLLITTPRPDNQQLTKYYLSDNYISHSNKAKNIFDYIYLLARRYTLKSKLRLITKFQSKPGKILDYGCGTGEFLETCNKAGWDNHGIEPSDNARSKANVLNNGKVKASLEELGDNSFDIITLWHVLEHVPDIEQTLSKLVALLSEKGKLCIAVPNHKSYDAEHYKQFWAAYDTPRHLWHFSPKSMENLMIKNSLNHLETRPMKLDAFYVSLLSEKYKNGGSVGIKNMITSIINGVRSNLKGKKNGNYSSLIYIAQK